MEKLVFIIDDDPVYLKFMQNHFRLLGGFKTEVYATGEEALKNLSKEPFMIILDHNLQEATKNGIHYLKEIRRANNKIPVVYITGDTDPELSKKVNNIGVEGFIIKDNAFLVYLRTVLDDILSGKKKRSFLKSLFKIGS
ncbi:MAG TPA: response regulator [Cyclobacteriaceae bacterium]|nr:response regulator [Cyclobacteriaceae bacterium]